MRLLFAILLCFPCQAVTLLRVSCGSTGGTDASGNGWTADAGFAGGYAWTAANQPALGSQNIPYRAMRASSGAPFTYTLTPSGPYTSVTLKFIEPNKTAAGQRVFSISINGTVTNSAVDIFGSVGLLKPFDLLISFTGSGPLTITLTPTQGNAVLSGIQVDGPAPPSPVTFLQGLESAMPPSCSLGTLYFTTDAAPAKPHAWWCTSAGTWLRILSDVPIAHVFTPSGSCSSIPPGLADCTGIYAIEVVTQDGLTRGPILGVAYPALPPPVIWTEVDPVTLPLPHLAQLVGTLQSDGSCSPFPLHSIPVSPPH